MFLDIQYANGIALIQNVVSVAEEEKKRKLKARKARDKQRDLQCIQKYN